MKDRPSRSSFNTKVYQLPHQQRVCGHLAAGRPCAPGPDGSGECRVQSVCEPWYDGSQWYCTRPKAFGGRCSEGPMVDSASGKETARCPHQTTPCRPVRSLRSKRNLVAVLTAGAAVAVCVAMIAGGSGKLSDTVAGTTWMISPGPLSAHHATMNQGCSACHSAATRSPVSLLSCAFGSAGSIDDSHKCLKCHRELGEHALLPHSVSPTRLSEAKDRLAEREHTTEQLLSRLLTSHSTTADGGVACSTCHQEHQGAAFDLTAMTNARCQSCHASTFHSFADGHPQFPLRPRADLHFDHVTHMTLHFRNFERLMPDGKARMQCSDCHTPESGGETMRLASFQRMCASCHSQQIRDYDVPPSARLHQLVLIDRHVSQADHAQPPPFVKLMLPHDSTGAESVSQLVENLATEGAETVRRQLHMACDSSTDSAMIEACVTALEDAHFFDAVAVFRKALLSEAEPGGLVYGNWRMNPDGMQIIYDCDRHADPVLRTWIDLLGHNARQYPEPPLPGPDGVFDRFLREMVAPESTGRCLKCHSVEKAVSGGLTVNWESQHGRSSSRSFTHFSHKPHLTLLSSDEEMFLLGAGQRCETCHPLSDDSFSLVSPVFRLDDGMPNPHEIKCSALGVQAFQRQNCAECHTPSLAGDNCLQCHNYHVHKPPDVRRSP